ncbi:MAG: hypothetical protein QOG67_675, partial [Verrucomicrobiota bacterium]
KGNGDRTFQPAISVPVGTNPTSLALDDFDGDGKIDIAVTNLVDNTVSVLINQSTPGTISFKAAVNYPVGVYPAGVVTGDFNHDGKVDLAVLNSGDFFTVNTTTLSILLGDGQGTFAPAATQQLWKGYGGDAIVAGDFGRGEIDLAVAHFGNGELMVLHGQGNGTFTAGPIYNVGSGPEGIVAADFNRDGRVDLAVNGLNDCTVALLVGNGDGTFVSAAEKSDDAARPFGFATWGYPAYIAAGDLNGDGKPEIVTTHLFEAAIAVLHNSTLTADEINKLLKITAITRLANGHVALQGRGIANRTIRIEASSDLNGGNFVTIASVAVDAAGAFQFEDSNASMFSQRFYRLAFP